MASNEVGEPRYREVEKAIIDRVLSRDFRAGERLPNSAELAVLRALAKEAESRIPVDPVLKIRQALDKAIREERYEEAASLRDQLRKASGQAE